jgi:hypothetical protein
VTNTRLCQWLGRVVCGAALGTAGLLLSEQPAPAQTYVCPPPPEGVYGLPGGPKFAESPPPPDTFYSQLDDPRWNGAWREDFATVSSTETGVRMLQEGTNLFVSFEGKVDPDGPGGPGSTDQVFFGFGAGTTAVIVETTMTAAPPQTNAGTISTSHWWKTTNGGATDWAQQALPLSWASGSNIHLWSGTGTGNGDSWAFNAKLDLNAIAGALGVAPPLTNFSMWYEIDVSTTTATIPYSWPPGTTVTLIPDPMNPGKQLVHNMLVSTWGTGDPPVASCPTGISVDPMHIGTQPVVAGIPDSTVHFGTGHASNDFVAIMDNGAVPISDGSVKARFRIANWGSMIGVGGDWHDMAPTSGAGVPTNVATNIDFVCVNPPAVGTLCPQLSAGQPTDQCLLVELSQATGLGVKFLHDSARRNMAFVDASTFERLAEVSVRGLTPLPGSGGKRDVYLYVRVLNMPEKTNGNPPIQIPPRVPPPPPPSQDGGTPGQDGGPVIGAPVRGPRDAQDAGSPGPQYRMTDYERYASVMPTYEVHVYHDTGLTRTDGGRTLKVLEPQAPFGYFVRHQGDLTGWANELTGEGFVLEQIGPNFYRAHVPDNGSVVVRTKIVAREPPKVPACHCNCDVVGSAGWSPLAIGLGGLGVSALAIRARRRKRAEPPRRR